MSKDQPFFQLHVFCCTTKRPPESDHASCGASGSQDLAAYLKDKVKAMELDGVRINPASCLGRCDEGPTIVVYPEGTWYKAASPEDMDEILQSHIVEGRPVARLVMA